MTSFIRSLIPLARSHHKLPHARQLFNGAFKTPESKVLDKITAVPFYELSRPPLPIQLNWLFLFLDAVFTGAGVALAWRYWTYPAQADEEGAPPKQELRPANQRLALACFHIGIGSVVALRLFNVRRSHVRKLWLFPRSVPGNYRRAAPLPPLDTLVVENYALFNPRVEFTLERNAYRFSSHKQDAILRLTPPGGREDGFVLLTEGVQIDGKPASRSEALGEILDPFQQTKAIADNSTKTKTHRTIEREDRARYHAQVSILEDLARQLRSGEPISDEEVTRLKNLAQVHGRGEGQKQPAEAIQWSEVVWGRKAADDDKKNE